MRRYVAGRAAASSGARVRQSWFASRRRVSSFRARAESPSAIGSPAHRLDAPGSGVGGQGSAVRVSARCGNSSQGRIPRTVKDSGDAGLRSGGLRRDRKLHAAQVGVEQTGRHCLARSCLPGLGGPEPVEDGRAEASRMAERISGSRVSLVELTCAGGDLQLPGPCLCGKPGQH